MEIPKEIIDALNSHDWAYDYAEDRRTFEAGVKQKANIIRLLAEFYTPDMDKRQLWEALIIQVPEQFKNNMVHRRLMMIIDSL